MRCHLLHFTLRMSPVAGEVRRRSRHETMLTGRLPTNCNLLTTRSSRSNTLSEMTGTDWQTHVRSAMGRNSITSGTRAGTTVSIKRPSFCGPTTGISRAASTPNARTVTKSCTRVLHTIFWKHLNEENSSQNIVATAAINHEFSLIVGRFVAFNLATHILTTYSGYQYDR